MNCPYLSSTSIDLECLLMSRQTWISNVVSTWATKHRSIDRSRTVSTWAAHGSILSGSCCWGGSRSTQKLKLQSSHSLQQQKHDDEFELGSRNRIKKIVKKKHESCRDCNPAQIMNFRCCAHLLQLLRVSSFKCTIARSIIWVAPNRTPISATRCVAEDKTKKNL